MFRVKLHSPSGGSDGDAVWYTNIRDGIRDLQVHCRVTGKAVNSGVWGLYCKCNSLDLTRGPL